MPIPAALSLFHQTNAAGNQQANLYDALGTLDVQLKYCYLKLTSGTNTYFEDLGNRVQRYVAEFSIFQGEAPATSIATNSRPWGLFSSSI